MPQEILLHLDIGAKMSEQVEKECRKVCHPIRLLIPSFSSFG